MENSQIKATETLMNLDVEFFDKLPPSTKVSDDIWQILKQADHDFVPPLSSRNGPKDIALSNSFVQNSNEPDTYFEEMSKQSFLTVTDRNGCVGFISYRKNYFVPELNSEVNAYVSTIIIKRTYEGNGIATYLYQNLKNHLSQKFYSFSLATRTWHTNYGHISILKKLEFKLAKEIKNGRGNGINTVIYIYNN